MGILRCKRGSHARQEGGEVVRGKTQSEARNSDGATREQQAEDATAPGAGGGGDDALPRPGRGQDDAARDGAQAPDERQADCADTCPRPGARTNQEAVQGSRCRGDGEGEAQRTPPVGRTGTDDRSIRSRARCLHEAAQGCRGFHAVGGDSGGGAQATRPVSRTGACASRCSRCSRSRRCCRRYAQEAAQGRPSAAGAGDPCRAHAAGRTAGGAGTHTGQRHHHH